jgi:hypothetical protein
MATLRHGSLVMIRTALVINCACSGPTAPKNCKDEYGRGETRLNLLTVSCPTVGSQLQCQAVASISGLYVYCPMQQDVTQAAGWTTGDSSIVRNVAPGVFEAVSPGDTVVNAAWQNLPSYNPGLPVSVFPGTPPFRTYDIEGSVFLNGQIPLTAINGASIQILNGLVAGRAEISGVTPTPLPGYSSYSVSLGHFRFLGVPPGTYRLSVTKDGYRSQERDVTVSRGTPPIVKFELDPIPE